MDLAVGIIGLGAIGGNIARRLLDEGFRVVGYDLDDEKLNEIVAHGAVAADSPFDVAATCDIVLTSLPNTKAVEHVYLDDDGIVAGGDEDLVAIELSTVDPDLIVEIAERARGAQIHLIGAPVSGGTTPARNGNLTLIIGGDSDVIRRESVQTVLSAIGNDRYVTGEIGTSHTIKIINNMMALSNTLVAMEAMALGAARGIDGETLLEVISKSSGGSNQFRKRFPRVLNRDFDQGFTVDYVTKDLELYVEMAESIGSPACVAELVQRLYVEASAEGYGSEGPSSVVKLYESKTGVEVSSNSILSDDFTGY